VRAISGLWRWRRNPLRRTTDLVEAWVALAALVLIAVAAPVTGSLGGTAAQSFLQQAVRNQRHARHLVTATVIRRLGVSTLTTDPEATGTHEARSRVLADWTAPDGTRQYGLALASLQSPHRGEHFTLWTDPHGRIAPRPLDSATATSHAVLAGIGAAGLSAGLVEAGRRMIVWRMVRRRYERWDQAWDRAGPDWGKAGTGS
jgi:hypothetical protein